MKVRLTVLIVVLAVLVPAGAAAQEVVEYYALDAVGSVRVVFNPDGTVKGRMDYMPFGGELQPAVGLPPEAFAGLFRDPEAGLDHAQARSYQVRTGRFASVDPIYAGLFKPQKWNRYTYARNSPLGFVDPSGLSEQRVHPSGMIKVGGQYVHVQGFYDSIGLRGAGSSGPGDDTMLIDPGVWDTGDGSETTGTPPTQTPPTTTPTGKNPDGDGNKSIATKLTDAARRILCAVIPSARVMGLDGAVGALVSPTGTVTATINYDTGMVELGTAGGVTVGWNGGATGNVSAGLTWGRRTPGPDPVILGGTASAKALFGGGLSGQGVEGTFSLSAQIGIGFPSVSAGMTVMKPGPVVAAGSVARYGTAPDVALTIVRNRVCR